MDYIESNENEQEYDIRCEDVEEIDVNVVELKAGPPYVCKILKPYDVKILSNSKMINFSQKLIRST